MNPKKTFNFILVVFIMLIFNVSYFLNITNVVTASFVSSITTYVIPISIFLIIYKLNIKETLNIHKINFRHILATIVCTILLLPFANLVSLISEFLFPNNIAVYLESILNLPFWQTLLIIAIFPAIFEEIVMRGMFLSGFKGYSIHFAALMNGLFFCMLHFDFQQGMYTFLFGIFLTYLVYYTGSIISAVISHFIFNGSTVFSLYYLKMIGELENAMNANAEALAMIDIIYYAIPAITFAFVSFFIFNTQIVKKPNLLYEKSKNDIKNAFSVPFFICICFYGLVMFLLYYFVY